MIWLALAFMGGVAFHFYPALGFAGLACLLVDRRAGFWAVGLCFAILGALIGPKPGPMIAERREFSGEVVVAQAPRPTPTGERVVVMTSGQKLVMDYDTAAPVSFGDVLIVSGRVQPLLDKSREYWRLQGVGGALKAEKSITRVSRGPPLFDWGQQVRRSFVAYTQETLKPRARAIIQSVCFNHDAELSLEERSALSRSGIIHIISTSGMHVVLVAGFLSLLLSALPLPRWAQIGILILLLLVYATAASFRPPMVRSVIMAALWTSAYLFKREVDGLSATAASAILTLLIMPSAVFDVGFHLSFVTISALVMFVPQTLPEATSVWGWIWVRIKQSTWTSTIASVSAAPLLSYSFREFSIVGAVTNLVMAPLIPILAISSLISWLVGGALGNMIMTNIAEPLAIFCSGVARAIGNLPIAAIQTPDVPIWAVFGFYGFAALLWKPKRRPLDT